MKIWSILGLRNVRVYIVNLPLQFWKHVWNLKHKFQMTKGAVAQAISKAPQLKGRHADFMKKHLIIGITLSITSMILTKFIVNEPRKKAYAEYYKYVLCITNKKNSPVSFCFILVESNMLFVSSDIIIFFLQNLRHWSRIQPNS